MKTKSTKPSREDPVNLIHTAQLRKGRVVKYTAGELAWSAFSFTAFERKRSTERKPTRRGDNTHPKLKEWSRKRPLRKPRLRRIRCVGTCVLTS